MTAECPLCRTPLREHTIRADGLVSCERVKDSRVGVFIDLEGDPAYPDVWIRGREGAVPVLTSVEGGGYEVTAR